MDTEKADTAAGDSLDLAGAELLVRRRRAPYHGQGGPGGCTKIPQQKCNKVKSNSEVN